ncbi:MAG: ComF family protein [Lachnospira sp.]
MNLRIIADSMADVFFPPACPICGKSRPFVDGVRVDICPECMGKISYIQEPRCLKCGKSIENDEREYCRDCENKKHIFTRCVSVYEYSEGIKKSVYNFKYHNKREYAAVYGREMSRKCGIFIKMWNPDVIMPVPVHISRLKRRGFNQAELIALELGRNVNVAVDTQSLIRIKRTKPMKELDNQDRIKNLENAFQVSENVVRYRKVLLVDDIYTTGTTLDMCAKSLINSGIKEVYGITLCVGKGF